MRKLRPYGCDETNLGSDYRSDELELFKAVERYKHQQRLKFVSIREVLEIVKSLGYRKIDSSAVSSESSVAKSHSTTDN